MCLKIARTVVVVLLGTASSLSAALTKTTTTITSSLNPSAYGQAVTFTATVSSSLGAPPNGEIVTFEQGNGTVLGTGMLTAGSAAFTISTLKAGVTDDIKAKYAGDSTFAGSTSIAVPQVVDLAETTTTLVSSQNPSSEGQSVTFTASVAAESGGTVTGNVAFNSGSTKIGQVALSGGVASYTTTTLAIGSDSITAAYKGSTSFATSTSGALSQVVGGPAATTTSLSSSENPANVEQPVTFTANVTTESGTTVTGTVGFYNGTAMLGKETLSGGVATFTTTKQVAATEPITAVYNGSSSFATSTSGEVSQTWGVGTFVDSTMTWNGVTRYYEVFLPTALPASPAMVLMLHGTRYTASAADYEDVISLNWGWNTVADQYGFILVKPASTYDPATTQWNWNAYCMDGTVLCDPDGSNGGAFPYAEGCGSKDGECPDDIGFLGALIQDLTTQYKVNPNQVYVTGFSSGAQMTERVGLELPNLVAAIAPVAGPIYNAQGTVPPPLPLPPVPSSFEPISVQLWEGTEDQNLWPCGYGQTSYSSATFTVDSADDTINFWTGPQTNACTTFQTTATLCAGGVPNNANDAPTPGISGDTGNIATGCSQSNIEVQFIWEPGVAHNSQPATNVNRWLFFAAHPKQPAN
jgi:poly(3-hydroxybutyrate) depolymerase